MKEIEDWAKDPCGPPVYCLNGSAGTGKTAIAQTITIDIRESGQVVASFFCSGKNQRSMFPMLAVQLADECPMFRSDLVGLIHSDSDVIYEPLQNQMKTFILELLQESGISNTTIVIDALDECEDEGKELLSVLERLMSDIQKFNIKFFITSRLEPIIEPNFCSLVEPEGLTIFALHEVEPSQVRSDIRLYLEHNLLGIGGCQGGTDTWLVAEDLNLLCDYAEGLFFYAVEAVRFVSHGFQTTQEGLAHLLHSPGEIDFDSLYRPALNKAFHGLNKPEDKEKLRSTIGAVVLAATSPISPPAIAMLLNYKTDPVVAILVLFKPLLVPQKDGSVLPLHKSLGTFLTHPKNSDEEFYVSPPTQSTTPGPTMNDLLITI